MGIIALFLDLVLRVPTGLRAASGVLNLLFASVDGPSPSLPSPYTGRFWILRLGLYELTRPKEKADDWVWIVDHTIQMGSAKCLLIVGCRLSQWQDHPRPLEHCDLQMLAMEPVEQSNGEIVCQQLEDTVEVTGIPRQIISDGGSDLSRGISLFNERHPQVSKSYDVAHKMAIFLKKMLTKDSRWQDFLRRAAQNKKEVVHTPLAFLAPPKLSDQARYMNLEPMLKWANNTRRFMDDPVANDGSLAEAWRVQFVFKWLRDFDDVLPAWQCLFDIVQTTLHFVRWHGYHQDTGTMLRARLTSYAGYPQADALIEQVVSFVEEQSASAKVDERLIGSTECLESLIGKGKDLEAQQRQGGFTVMLLGIAATVVGPAHELIERALAAVKTKDVCRWARDKLGLTVQARRRRAFSTPLKGTKPG